MIEDIVKIHDRFSLEFKLGFTAAPDQEINDFLVNMWIYIPNSLDVNKYTYSKNDYYRDVKSTVRLITPIYLLRDIANPEALPLKILSNSIRQLAENPTKLNVGNYETQIKMFQSILRSALRDEAIYIQNVQSANDKQDLIDSYLENTLKILHEYRKLRPLINIHTIDKNVFEYYLFGDEFMSNLVEVQYFEILKYLSIRDGGIYEKNKYRLLGLIESEIAYKKENNYPVIEKISNNHNRNVVSRFSALRRYIESQLYLSTKKREDGAVVKQIYYSIAAGISMIFATVIAFSFQLKYGNFTLPLFIALVVGYMLKDRIKELSRVYFTTKLGKKYFDNKTSIKFNNVDIGTYRESQAFVKEDQMPVEVVQLRNRSAILEAENRIDDEKIIQYRFQVVLDRGHMNASSVYPITGINDIIRFNVSQYIRKMDNPVVPLYITDETADWKIIEGEKIYYLNVIMHLSHNEQNELKRYRIAFNRDGIKDLEQL